MPSWRNIPSIPNVRDSSGTIGTMRSPIAGSRTSVLRMRTNAIVVEFARSPLPSSTVVNGSGVGSGSAVGVTRREAAAERRAALEQVLQLRAVLGRAVEERARRLLVAERQSEPVADREPRLLVHRLLLVGDVPALAGHAHAEALDRLREDHGRLAGRLDGGGVGGIDLLRVVAAAPQLPDLLVASSPPPSPASRGTCRRSARGRRHRPST